LQASPFTALLGGAGTGKTTLIREWMASLTDNSLVLTASTGIAAINAGGTTINAVLKFFDSASLVDLYTTGSLQARLRKLRKGGVTRLILDEVSMVPADQLTVLVRAIDEINGQGYDVEEVEDEGEAPQFGLTVVGDFCQLPPVKAPFAFESPEWDRFAVTKLDRVYRQQDPAFVEALRAARRGDGAAAVDVLSQCFVHQNDPHFDGPTLLAKNLAVDRYNGLRMDTLKTPERAFSSTRWGQQRGEWKQIPETLVLKEGALVMVLANYFDQDLGEYLYVNGDLGTFLGMDGASARVALHRTGAEELIAPVQREVLEPLEVGERKAMKAAGQEGMLREKQKVTGAIRYMPLRVAWATSIHKSQSLSFDAVQVSLREPFAGAPAMTYVALSRARSLAGLRIVGSPATFIARCVTDKRVAAWI